MSNLREAATQALEALKQWNKPGYTLRNQRAAAALKAALAEPRSIQECYGDCPTNPQTCPNPCNFEGRPRPVQEPVAYWNTDESSLAFKPGRSGVWVPLYADPKPCPTCVSLARAVMMDQMGSA